MSVGLGHLQLSPEQFWRATPREFFAAVQGYSERMGGGRSKVEPMTREEALEGFARIEAEQKAKAEMEKETG